MENRKCPDCKNELINIKLFGRGWENPLSGAAVDTELVYYTDIDSKRSALLGMHNPKGIVEAFLCNQCGRILLFGRKYA